MAERRSALATARAGTSSRRQSPNKDDECSPVRIRRYRTCTARDYRLVPARLTFVCSRPPRSGLRGVTLEAGPDEFFAALARQLPGVAQGYDCAPDGTARRGRRHLVCTDRPRAAAESVNPRLPARTRRVHIRLWGAGALALLLVIAIVVVVGSSRAGQAALRPAAQTDGRARDLAARRDPGSRRPRGSETARRPRTARAASHGAKPRRGAKPQKSSACHVSGIAAARRRPQAVRPRAALTHGSSSRLPSASQSRRTGDPTCREFPPC
jgi:hypothetical protein